MDAADCSAFCGGVQAGAALKVHKLLGAVVNVASAA
jgi:hypothetical protein